METRSLDALTDCTLRRLLIAVKSIGGGPHEVKLKLRRMTSAGMCRRGCDKYKKALSCQTGLSAVDLHGAPKIDSPFLTAPTAGLDPLEERSGRRSTRKPRRIRAERNEPLLISELVTGRALFLVQCSAGHGWSYTICQKGFVGQGSALTGRNGCGESLKEAST